MLAFSVSSGRRENFTVKTTLYVEGEVTSSDCEKLRKLCLDALIYSDQFVLNAGRVSCHDYSFSILACQLRKTLQLLGKKLYVDGEQMASMTCEYEYALGKRKGCSFNKAKTCSKWEDLFTKAGT